MSPTDQIETLIISDLNPNVLRAYKKGDHDFDRLRSYLLAHLRLLSTVEKFENDALEAVKYLVLSEGSYFEVFVSWNITEAHVHTYTISASVLVRVYMNQNQGTKKVTFEFKQPELLTRILLQTLGFPEDGILKKDFPIVGSKPKEEEKEENQGWKRGRAAQRTFLGCTSHTQQSTATRGLLNKFSL